MLKLLRKEWILRIQFFFFFTVMSSFLFANDALLLGLSDGDRAWVDDGLPLLNQVITMQTAGNSTPEKIISLAEQAEALFKKIQDKAVRYYYLAQIEIQRGRMVLQTEKKRARARPYFEKAMDFAQKSVDERIGSDSLRVLASAATAWMLTKGLPGIIKMAPDVKEWSDQAVAMDSQNAKAIILSAQGKINAPKIAGGNPEVAVSRLQALLQREDLTDVERFGALLTLSLAYSKLRKKDEAKQFCKEASFIFPNSPGLEQCR